MSLNLLERLNSGETIMGDGGFVFALEKRGYVKAGPWTPEAVVEHPEAVKQLHREFMRAGSDVMQTFTFYASDDKLKNRGNEASAKYSCKGINNEACKIAREVAQEGKNVMVAGGICQTPTYLSGASKEDCQKMFEEQLDCFVANGVDFMIAEYFEHVEECEWAIESCLKTGLPVCANMCIGPEGDLHGNSVAQCAERMALAGAHVVGVNCHFDPFVSLEAMKLVKEGLVKCNKWPQVHMMVQPLAFMTPDAGKQGFIDLPEFPFALEPRICTRWEMAKFAREAYELGVRFIGGCCGFEAYHIRACADELSEERGRRPDGGEKWIPGAGGLQMHTKPWVRARGNAKYWNTIKPALGRVDCPCVSHPDAWGLTQGDAELKQQKEATSKDDLEKLRSFSEEIKASAPECVA
jgi:betaine-homocysteine S-methyltransferase